MMAQSNQETLRRRDPDRGARGDDGTGAGGDLSLWGLSNAITLRAQAVDNYEVASQMEKAGGQVIELPRSKWEVAA